MRRIPIVLLLSGLLLGASKCSESPEQSGDGATEARRDAGVARETHVDGGGQDGLCGSATCAEGQVCCNDSCGICTEPGGFCTQQACEQDAGERDAGERDAGERDAGEPGDEPSVPPDAGTDAEPEGEPCGETTCSAGEVCCNESCGVCTEPGGACDLQLCVEEPGEDEFGPFCGGFAAFACDGAGECVDDPRDDCDPQNGGADCSGVCECSRSESCEAGSAWNADPAVCACERAGAGGGVACGDATCASGEVCCNASCGVCTLPGESCLQIICD